MAKLNKSAALCGSEDWWREGVSVGAKRCEVEMPVRKVKVYELELLDYKYPELRVRCKVSSGTYIRALGEEIGRKLGVEAYLTELRRTKVGDYRVEEAKTLAELGVD